MNVIINRRLIFVDSFQFLSSSLDSLIKNMGKTDFKYLSQKFDSKVLKSGFERFKKRLSDKESFYSLLAAWCYNTNRNNM